MLESFPVDVSDVTQLEFMVRDGIRRTTGIDIKRNDPRVGICIPERSSDGMSPRAKVEDVTHLHVHPVSFRGGSGGHGRARVGVGCSSLHLERLPPRLSG